MPALLDVVQAVRPLVSRAKSLSFSQYGEDLLLAVSLLPNRRGRYVDVGAYHPWKESNTYKLYLRGWTGLTIEPNPDAAALFRKKRPRDVHVVSGVAAEAGELTYHRFADPKLNTFSESQAKRFAANGSPTVDELTVPCRRLQDILDEHGLPRSTCSRWTAKASIWWPCRAWTSPGPGPPPSWWRTTRPSRS